MKSTIQCSLYLHSHLLLWINICLIMVIELHLFGFRFILFLSARMCICLCESMPHVYRYPQSIVLALDCLELESRAVMSGTMWVLGTDPPASRTTASSLNWWGAMSSDSVFSSYSVASFLKAALAETFWKSLQLKTSKSRYARVPSGSLITTPTTDHCTVSGTLHTEGGNGSYCRNQISEANRKKVKNFKKRVPKQRKTEKCSE